MLNEELTYYMNQPLNVKVALSKTRIREWNKVFNGSVYVAFSGGVDSLVLLHLVRDVLGADVVAVFVDTGLEYPEIREFVKSFPNVEFIKPKLTFTEVVKKYGYPVISKSVSRSIYDVRHSKSEKLRDKRLNGDEKGNMGVIPKKYRYLIDAPFEISDKCCDIMKKSPFHKYEKRTGNHPFVGTLVEESERRKTSWMQHGCNAFDMKYPQSRPLSFWTRQDILQYIYMRII